MKHMKSRHIRRSKRGKLFYAGKGMKKHYAKKSKLKHIEKLEPKTLEQKAEALPNSLKKEVFEEQIEEKISELKKEKRTVIPDIGILKIKTRKARPARMGVNPLTGEKMKFKAKPAMKVVKFRPAKSLKEEIA